MDFQTQGHSLTRELFRLFEPRGTKSNVWFRERETLGWHVAILVPLFFVQGKEDLIQNEPFGFKRLLESEVSVRLGLIAL